MIPILFAPSATSFNTNGIGRLSDATECTVIEELNGQFELEMTYPMGGRYFKDIRYSSIIVAKPYQNGAIQAFRVYKISKPMSGKVKIYARHITYQLNFIPCSPFSGQSAATVLANIKTAVAEYCPFNFTTDIDNKNSWMLYEPRVIRSFLLGEEDSIQTVYGGEFLWDNYNVKLLQNRGSNKGVKIRYGKNLVDLTQEENIENTITGIYPIWKSDGTIVELPEKVLHSQNAVNFPFLRTEVHDFTSEFDEMPSVEDLRKMAQLYVLKEDIGVPEIGLTVNFVNLSETSEYADVLELQSVNLGDTVTVEFPALEVSATQKVTKTEYDVLSERYTSITIGNSVKTVASTIEQQMNELSEKINAKEAHNSIDRATGVLNAGTRGHVIIARNDQGFANEIFFLDDENVAKAKNVLRINVNGIGFSSSGIRGPYYQSWTLDGHLALGGVNNNHGTLEILDKDGNAIGIWNNEGLYVKNGKIESGQFSSKNGEFYVIENDNKVEVGWTGWFVEDGAMRSNELKWRTNDSINPASGTSSSASINGGCQADDEDTSGEPAEGCDEDEGGTSEGSTAGYAGTAGFKALWLDDQWFERPSSNWSYTEEGRSQHHLWDVAETLKWLASRATTLESRYSSLDQRVTALEQSCRRDGECGDDQCSGDCQSYDWECPSDEGDIPCNSDEGCTNN